MLMPTLKHARENDPVDRDTAQANIARERLREAGDSRLGLD
jgi:hypothetical protein